MVYLIAVLCVVGIAAGQIMFKLSAGALQRAGTFFEIKTLIMLGSAFALYGLTTIAWVWVLQKIDLGKAYPLMAMAFVLVPIGSHFILGERFQTQYFVGVLFIMFGIVLAVKS
ncbi:MULTISPECIES: 4-amino-4-deoxy-L-arabinose-phospho-UDP flippase [Pseudomonas]|uniref:4-amino-4-deoxy-L-arabinose-phospho-UDP flippase n=1 Tax=Pseudomonas TaxID=286 RepID=UPI001BAEB908|nr:MULTISPECIES: 4-amino-4-deoxy-L-arabinose-phospho-UDP flippase [Pseudomonas]MBS4089764.1 4-amino-4-deoxy-L-arabinose-phospho-UDP flippase [Pseudomonas rustica]MEB0191021.1 4-amino-4-deoxy-L-arabinose-phospho-UDP flippase [Pseudomonas sp. CCI1.1]WPX49356.1 4-amino-4-deoxy-L-arabinose-phospho-UDP flippase [Pseudomonas sp. CCI1.1]